MVNLRQPLSYQELVEAEERGRRMAAAKILQDSEARARVEAAFGVDYCQRRYPEVYTELAKSEK